MTTSQTNGAKRVWEPGYRMLTAGVLLVVMLVASEALAIATVMPLVEKDLGQIWLYGWVFSAFFLGSLVGIVVAGHAADRISVALPFTVGLVLFAGGLLLGGLATSMPMLVAARATQGLGAGALPAIAYVCIGRGYHPDVRPRMIAMLSTAWVVPSLVAPALAGVVGQHIGWRWVFLGLLPLVAAFGSLAVAGLRRIPMPDVPAEGTSLLRAVMVSIGTALVLAGLSIHNLVSPVLVVVGVVVGLPALRSLVPPGTLVARPGLPTAVLTRGLLTMMFFCTDAYVPLALSETRGMSASMIGVLLILSSGGWTVGSWVQERSIGRRGPRVLIRVGFGVVALAAGGIALMLAPRVPVAVAYISWMLGGLGMGTAYASVAVTVLAEAEPGREGTASAALQLSDTLGMALGTGIGGALVAIGASIGWTVRVSLVPVFLLSSLVGLAGLVVGRGLPLRVAERPG